MRQGDGGQARSMRALLAWVRRFSACRGHLQQSECLRPQAWRSWTEQVLVARAAVHSQAFPRVPLEEIVERLKLVRIPQKRYLSCECCECCECRVASGPEANACLFCGTQATGGGACTCSTASAPRCRQLFRRHLRPSSLSTVHCRRRSAKRRHTYTGGPICYVSAARARAKRRG